jgi:hypothetical protein
MTAICTHLDEIRIEPPEAVAGCEDWSWCYLDEVAFVVEPGA